jgi:predicted KAP-like P-loop ATPase
MSFNPWLHSGRDELFQSFFNTTYDELKTHPQFNYDNEIVHALRDLFDHLEPVTNFFKRAMQPHKLTEQMLEAWSKEPPLKKQKSKLLNFLETKNVSVIVTIDELDRLGDEEIRAMIQVVKSIGDFHCFSYLIAPIRSTPANRSVRKDALRCI